MKIPSYCWVFSFAEEVRFELTVPCETLVFKTSAIDHSATPPSGIPVRVIVSENYGFAIEIKIDIDNT